MTFNTMEDRGQLYRAGLCESSFPKPGPALVARRLRVTSDSVFQSRPSEMSFHLLGPGLDHAITNDALLTLRVLEGFCISILPSHLWGNGHSYIIILDTSRGRHKFR